jgi:hypothetical protein
LGLRFEPTGGEADEPDGERDCDDDEEFEEHR